ncbi:MAG: YsnF/AvaK domain-containing protein [Thermomicrobiales bacterium]
MMSGFENIHDGMMVYGADNQPLGTIEDVKRDRIRVNGRDLKRDDIARVTADGVYVRGMGNDYMQGTASGYATDAGTTRGTDTDYARGGAMRDRGETRDRGEMRDRGEIAVPTAEERLNVEKRQSDLGTVDIHKNVTEEQQSVPVELRREEVNVERRNVEDRPLREGDDAFHEGTIRVPVRGEEAVVSKEPVVTGEVVVTKGQTTARQEVRDTVRKQDVDVDENYRKARSGFQEHFNQRGQRGRKDRRTFDQAEPNYRYGYMAAQNNRYAGQEFDQAEPALQRDYQRDYQGSQTGDSWDQLREEIHEGWDRARGRS